MKQIITLLWGLGLAGPTSPLNLVDYGLRPEPLENKIPELHLDKNCPPVQTAPYMMWPLSVTDDGDVAALCGGNGSSVELFSMPNINENLGAGVLKFDQSRYSVLFRVPLIEGDTIELFFGKEELDLGDQSDFKRLLLRARHLGMPLLTPLTTLLENLQTATKPGAILDQNLAGSLKTSLSLLLQLIHSKNLQFGTLADLVEDAGVDDFVTQLWG